MYKIIIKLLKNQKGFYMSMGTGLPLWMEMIIIGILLLLINICIISFS